MKLFWPALVSKQVSLRFPPPSIDFHLGSWPEHPKLPRQSRVARQSRLPRQSRVPSVRASRMMLLFLLSLKLKKLASVRLQMWHGMREISRTNCEIFFKTAFFVQKKGSPQNSYVFIQWQCSHGLRMMYGPACMRLPGNNSLVAVSICLPLWETCSCCKRCQNLFVLFTCQNNILKYWFPLFWLWDVLWSECQVPGKNQTRQQNKTEERKSKRVFENLAH